MGGVASSHVEGVASWGHRAAKITSKEYHMTRSEGVCRIKGISHDKE